MVAAMKVRHVLAGAAVVIAAVLIVNWQAIFYRLAVAPQFSSERVEVPGAYYRYVYKFVHDGSEDMVFDTVVACNTRVTGSKATGPSILNGLTPNLYAQRTRAGHAVLVVSPDVCSWARRGWDGVRREGFLPVVLWFEDADDLSSGLAYVSAQAYAGPNSRLKFVSSKIGPATREEWLAWRTGKDKRPANVVKQDWVRPGLGFGREARARYFEFWPGRKYFVDACHGYIRLKIAEADRAKFHKFWPAHRPRFWMPKGGDGNKAFWAFVQDDVKYVGAVPGEKYLRDFWFGPYEYFAVSDLAGEYGVVLRSNHRDYPGEYFPVMRHDQPPLVTPETGRADHRIWNVVAEGGRNDGYLYCQSAPRSKEERTYYQGDRRGGPIRLSVDEEPVFADPLSRGSITYFVEQDTHLWTRSRVLPIPNGRIE